MKTPRRWAILLSLLVVPLGAGVDRAAAATTEIGAVGEIEAATLPSSTAAGGFVVQVGEASGTYAVPPGFGTITSWRHSAGAVSGPLTFKVYRPTGTQQEFRVVGSDTQTVTARTVQSFPVQIPVAPGDRIGLSSEDVELAFETFDARDRIGFFEPDPPIGSTDTTDDEPFPEFKLDVAATLESTPVPDPGAGDQPPTTDPPDDADAPPAVSRLRVSPRALRAARRGPTTRGPKRRRRGTIASYEASVAARVRFKVLRVRPPGRRTGTGDDARCARPRRGNREAPRCRRLVRVKGGFTQVADSGRNAFYFSGRLRGRQLRPGVYRLVATPSVDGEPGKPDRRRFRIVRR